VAILGSGPLTLKIAAPRLTLSFISYSGSIPGALPMKASARSAHSQNSLTSDKPNQRGADTATNRIPVGASPVGPNAQFSALQTSWMKLP
jgi:hypothetical protein